MRSKPHVAPGGECARKGWSGLKSGLKAGSVPRMRDVQQSRIRLHDPNGAHSHGTITAK